MNETHSLKVTDAAIEEFNERDWENFGALHAENVILTAPTLPIPAEGREAVKAWAQGLATAFSDLQWEVTRSFAQDNQVCVEITARGTHNGPLQSPTGKVVPPTNKSVEMHIGGVFTIQDDMVSEVHLYNDLMSLLAQLGLAA